MKSKVGLLVFLNAALILGLTGAEGDDSTCKSSGCHDEMGTLKTVHPVLDACSFCHKGGKGQPHFSNSDTGPIHATPNGSLSFELFQPVPQLCFMCHPQLSEQKPVNHFPFQAGMCGLCHDFHQSDYHKRLKQPVISTCGMCHPDKKKFAENAHTQHPAIVETERACVNCHNPHYGEVRYRFQVTPVTELCGQCHVKIVDKVKSVSIEKRHGPIQENACNACHNPHGEQNFRMLRDSYPDKNHFYSSFSEEKYVCLRCHDSSKFEKNGLTGFKKDGVSLHYKHVNRQKGRTCRACHDPHASVNDHLINEKTSFGEWQFDLNWKREPDGTASCFPACHERRTYDGAAPPGTFIHDKPVKRSLKIEK